MRSRASTRSSSSSANGPRARISRCAAGRRSRRADRSRARHSGAAARARRRRAAAGPASETRAAASRPSASRGRVDRRRPRSSDRRLAPPGRPGEDEQRNRRRRAGARGVGATFARRTDASRRSPRRCFRASQIGAQALDAAEAADAHRQGSATAGLLACGRRATAIARDVVAVRASARGQRAALSVRAAEDQEGAAASRSAQGRSVDDFAAAAAIAGCRSSASARTVSTVFLLPHARAHRASRRSSSAARAISRWPDRIAAQTLAWPSPIEDAIPATSRAARRADLRAGERRSVLLRRRRAAAAPFRRRGNDLPARALGVLARRRAARLEPAGLRDALAARPRAGGDHPASAAARAHSRSVLGRHDAGQARATAGRARHRRARGSPSARRWAARASACARRRAEISRFDDIAPLNTIAVEIVAERGARVIPARARPARRLVRARRPDHQARNPRA